MLGTFGFGDPVLVKKSFNTYNTNDVLYFKYPIPDSSLSTTYLMQRVFGLPGDSFAIKDKKIFINGSPIEDTSSIKHNYYIKSVQALDSVTKVELFLNEGGAISESFDYSYSLTRPDAERLKNHPYIVSVDLKGEKAGSYDEACFPYSGLFVWNADHYGPVYIPKRDDTLRLDSVTIKLYAQIISQHEKNELRVNGDSIFINKELAKTNVVKKNYFFVLCDNRGNANDSRNWCYLPENMIVGKVLRSLRRNQ